jgi:hypothetical protein
MKNLDLLVRAMWLQTLEDLHDHQSYRKQQQRQKLTDEALSLKKLETKIIKLYAKH